MYFFVDHSSSVEFTRCESRRRRYGESGRKVGYLLDLYIITVEGMFLKCLRLPLPPGAMSTMWRNEERFLKTYFTKFPVSLLIVYLDFINLIKLR